MHHYNPETALEELTEDAVLPNPVHVRDMMSRAKLPPAQAVELTRKFHAYQKAFGAAQDSGRTLLEELVKLNPAP